jgi:hypothetical protein
LGVATDAVEAMESRMREPDESREVNRGGKYYAYTFDDGTRVVFHNGPNQVYVDLQNASGRMIARVGAISSNSPEWNRPGQRELRERIYQSAKVMQPRTNVEMAAIRALVSQQFTAIGGTGARTP